MIPSLFNIDVNYKRLKNCVDKVGLFLQVRYPILSFAPAQSLRLMCRLTLGGSNSRRDIRGIRIG